MSPFPKTGGTGWTRLAGWTRGVIAIADVAAITQAPWVLETCSRGGNAFAGTAPISPVVPENRGNERRKTNKSPGFLSTRSCPSLPPVFERPERGEGPGKMVSGGYWMRFQIESCRLRCPESSRPKWLPTVGIGVPGSPTVPYSSSKRICQDLPGSSAFVSFDSAAAPPFVWANPL